MSYYTERHGMRTPIEQTEIISGEMYALLFDCCEKYFDNIAWKYPEQCPDGNGCCGLDLTKLSYNLKYEIPALYQNGSGLIDKPWKNLYGFDSDFDQYGLLDFIEFMFATMHDITHKFWHGYYQHNDLSFGESKDVSLQFRKDINQIFRKTGLLYTLSESGMVERVNENAVLSNEIEKKIAQVPEKGIKELLQVAILLFKTPGPQARKDSVEKIWDALERLKTYYTNMDKKASTTKIISDMSCGRQEIYALFDDEFKALTKIGNDYRIRHHETNKIDITDSKHYDYFFNRCLSLIVLAIQYLK